MEQRLSGAYTEHYRNAIDNFIIAELGAEEFEGRVDARKKELSAEGGLWEQMSPALADSMARSALRAEVANDLAIISFQNFRQPEIPRLLVDFELSPADFGLGVLPITLDGVETTHPNSLYGSPGAIQPQNDVPPIGCGGSLNYASPFV